MTRFAAAAVVLGLALAVGAAAPRAEPRPDGLVQVRSAHPLAETVARLQAGLAGRGIRQFDRIDQAALAAHAGITVRPSVLLVFGNPAVGGRFVAARAEAGLDWPVRLLVHEYADGAVWMTYTAFEWTAQRYGIDAHTAGFETAAGVVAGLTAAAAAP